MSTASNIGALIASIELRISNLEQNGPKAIELLENIDAKLNTITPTSNKAATAVENFSKKSSNALQAHAKYIQQAVRENDRMLQSANKLSTSRGGFGNITGTLSGKSAAASASVFMANFKAEEAANRQHQQELYRATLARMKQVESIDKAHSAALIENAKRTSAALIASQKDIGNSMQQTKSHLTVIGDLMDRIGNRIKFLIAQFIAMTAVITIFRQISAAIKSSVEWLAKMEDAQIGIASTFIAQGKYVDAITGKVLTGEKAIEAALLHSNGIVKRLQTMNLETMATLDQLVETYQGLQAISMSKGLDSQKVLDLTLATVQAAGALKINFGLARTEMRQILEGVVTRRNVLASALNITPEDMKKYKDDINGLFNLIMQRTKSFQDMGPRIQKTWHGVWSNVKDIAEMMGGFIFEDMFTNVKKAVYDFSMSFGEVNKETGRWNILSEATIKRAKDLGESIQIAWNILASFPVGVIQYLSDMNKEMQNVDERAQSLHESMRILSRVWKYFQEGAILLGKSIGVSFAYMADQFVTFVRAVGRILTPLGHLIIGIFSFDVAGVKKALADASTIWNTYTVERKANIEALKTSFKTLNDAYNKKMFGPAEKKVDNATNKNNSRYIQNPPEPKEVEAALERLGNNWENLYKDIMGKGAEDAAVEKVNKTFNDLFTKLDNTILDFKSKKGLTSAIKAQIQEAREHLETIKPFELAIAEINVPEMRKEVTAAEQALGRSGTVLEDWEKRYTSVIDTINAKIRTLTDQKSVAEKLGSPARGEVNEMNSTIEVLTELSERLTDRKAKLMEDIRQLSEHWNTLFSETMGKGADDTAIERVNKTFDSILTQLNTAMEKFQEKHALTDAIKAQIEDAKRHIATIKPFELSIAQIDLPELKKEVTAAEQAIGRSGTSMEDWERRYNSVVNSINAKVKTLSAQKSIAEKLGSPARGEVDKLESTIKALEELKNGITDKMDVIKDKITNDQLWLTQQAEKFSKSSEEAEITGLRREFEAHTKYGWRPEDELAFMQGIDDIHIKYLTKATDDEQKYMDRMIKIQEMMRTATPIEMTQTKIASLQKALAQYQAQAEALGNISKKTEQYRTAIDKVAEAQERLIEAQMQLKDQTSTYWQGALRAVEDYKNSIQNTDFAKGVESMNIVISSIGNNISNVLDYASKDFLNFKSVIADVLHTIYMEILKIIVIAPIMKELFGSMTGGTGTGLIGGLLNGLISNQSGMTSEMTGWDMFSSGSASTVATVPTFDTGGKLGRDGLLYGHMGERVLTRKETKKYESGEDGGPLNVSVNVVNQSSAPVKGTTGSMNFDGEKYVVNVILKDLNNNGPVSRHLSNQMVTK